MTDFDLRAVGINATVSVPDIYYYFQPNFERKCINEYRSFGCKVDQLRFGKKLFSSNKEAGEEVFNAYFEDNAKDFARRIKKCDQIGLELEITKRVIWSFLSHVTFISIFVGVYFMFTLNLTHETWMYIYLFSTFLISIITFKLANNCKERILFSDIIVIDYEQFYNERKQNGLLEKDREDVLNKKSSK